MQDRRVGVFERRAARGEKRRQIGEVVAIGGERQARGAALGREHLEKGFEPPRRRALRFDASAYFGKRASGSTFSNRSRRRRENPNGQEQAAADGRQHTSTITRKTVNLSMRATPDFPFPGRRRAD